MNKMVKEVYKKAFKMDADDWMLSSSYDGRFVISFMYNSDEGHGSRTKCYADFELKTNGD